MQFPKTRVDKGRSKLIAHHSIILAQLLKLVPRHEFKALAWRFRWGAGRTASQPGVVGGAGTGVAVGAARPARRLGQLGGAAQAALPSGRRAGDSVVATRVNRGSRRSCARSCSAGYRHAGPRRRGI